LKIGSCNPAALNQTTKKILSAVAAVLQDLGFNLDESETKLGVVVASKDRDAVEAGQVVGAIVMAALFGANAATFDKNRKCVPRSSPVQLKEMAPWSALHFSELCGTNVVSFPNSNA